MLSDRTATMNRLLLAVGLVTILPHLFGCASAGAKGDAAPTVATSGDGGFDATASGLGPGCIGSQGTPCTALPGEVVVCPGPPTVCVQCATNVYTPSLSSCRCTSGTWDCAPPEAGTVECPDPVAGSDFYADPACSVPYGSDAGGAGAEGGGVDGGTCPPPVDGGLGPAQSAAGGTVTGPNLDATICNAGAYIYLSSATTPPGDHLFMLDSREGYTLTTFQAPPGANAPLLNASVLVSTPSPGVYRSSDSAACGFVDFEYDLPIPPGVECSDGAPPTCSPGCAALCSGLGCGSCMPSPPNVGYQAQAPSDCLGSPQTVLGSWTLTLTSVTPYTTDAGSSSASYIVHGTLAATLVGAADGGSDTATMSMSF
jgi:hypothetical protein